MTRPTLFLLVVLLLAGCSPARLPADPEAAAGHHRRARTLQLDKDYPAAAEQLARAQALDHTSGRYALAHGDLRQALGEYRRARDAWEEALDRLPVGAPERPEIAWRLALLQATRLGKPDAARRLADQLRPAGFRRLDLEGILLLEAGDPAAALRRFEQAIPLAHDPAQSAYARYHAALAHRRLGNERATFASLFEAINQATERGLIKDIETFFRDIRSN